MNPLDQLRRALQAKRIFDVFEKEHKQMGDYDFKKTLAKAAKDFIVTSLAVAAAAVGGALGEYFSKSENIEAAFAALPHPLVAVLIPMVSAVAVALLNWSKHRDKGMPNVPNVPKVVPVLILAMLPTLALAQDAAPGPVPPSPPTSSAALYCGAMQFTERDVPDHKDFVCRLSLNVLAPSGITLFGRADYTRTQDGGDLLDIKTFRSIEGFVGGRKDIAENLSLTAFTGVSWNRDDQIEPTDPRLWTVAGGLRYTVPGRGYVLAAVGHHGPVGGSAFLGSVVYDVNSVASWFSDVAIPLDATRFAARPYTVKFGISAKFKTWSL